MMWIDGDGSVKIEIVLEGYVYQTTHKDFIACSTIDNLLDAIRMDLQQIEDVKNGDS